MNESTKPDSARWTDPDDDYVEWTEEMFREAAAYKGGKLVRPATGTLKSALGRPRLDNPKRQVTLRLDPDVIERFRATGKGWQSRINAELRKALGI
ncbi:MAG: BrnA antitoxin family protein [Novosphingobium sp.]|nr:BrnA antitoxin family protein [Novosphingobium sp.]